MARPKRKGVDYFPHDCLSGKTLFIIEQKFGNDGYALWFKLLEFIGTKEGHFIDYNNPADRGFLAAKCRLDEVSVTEILDELANLDAIDRELWSQKIIWSAGFLERISDVYVKRRVEIPVKPSFCSENPPLNGVSVPESTQSKVKESKVKEYRAKALVGSVEPPHENGQALKKEYRELETSLSGKDMKEVWSSVTGFIRDKSPEFLEPYAAAWNIFATTYKLPPLKMISDSRRKKFATRIREPGFDFLKILEAIKVSPHLKGDNNRGWKTDFNWILENDSNYLKILEGNYN
jgi:hypothetical protein